MKLSEYKHLVSERESDWLTALEAHAEDTGAPLETVLAQSLIDRHRAAADLERASENLRATIKRITK